MFISPVTIDLLITINLTVFNVYKQNGTIYFEEKKCNLDFNKTAADKNIFLYF